MSDRIDIAYTPTKWVKNVDPRAKAVDPAMVGSGPVEDDRGVLHDVAVGFGEGAVQLGTNIAHLAAWGATNLVNLFKDEKEYVNFNKDLVNMGASSENVSKFFNQFYSQEAQQAHKAVADAEGFQDTVAAYLLNPRAITTGIAQSLPSMLPVFKVSGMAAKMAMKAGAAKGLEGKALDKFVQHRVRAAAGAAEGSVSALSVSQAIGEKNLKEGRDYGEGQGYALLAGAGTGVLGQFNPMEANIMSKGIVGLGRKQAIKEGEKVGLLKSATGYIKRPIKSGFKEGLEETLQSDWEQIMQNLGTGEDVFAELGKVTAQSFILGGATGTAMHSLTKKGTSVEDVIKSQNEANKKDTPNPPATGEEVGETEETKPAIPTSDNGALPTDPNNGQPPTQQPPAGGTPPTDPNNPSQPPAGGSPAPVDPNNQQPPAQGGAIPTQPTIVTDSNKPNTPLTPEEAASVQPGQRGTAIPVPGQQPPVNENTEAVPTGDVQNLDFSKMTGTDEEKRNARSNAITKTLGKDFALSHSWVIDKTDGWSSPKLFASLALAKVNEDVMGNGPKMDNPMPKMAEVNLYAGYLENYGPQKTAEMLKAEGNEAINQKGATERQIVEGERKIALAELLEGRDPQEVRNDFIQRQEERKRVAQEQVVAKEKEKETKRIETQNKKNARTKAREDARIKQEEDKKERERKQAEERQKRVEAKNKRAEELTNSETLPSEEDLTDFEQKAEKVGVVRRWMKARGIPEKVMVGKVGYPVIPNSWKKEPWSETHRVIAKRVDMAQHPEKYEKPQKAEGTEPKKAEKPESVPNENTKTEDSGAIEEKNSPKSPSKGEKPVVDKKAEKEAKAKAKAEEDARKAAEKEAAKKAAEEQKAKEAAEEKARQEAAAKELAEKRQKIIDSEEVPTRESIDELALKTKAEKVQVLRDWCEAHKVPESVKFNNQQAKVIPSKLDDKWEVIYDKVWDRIDAHFHPEKYNAASKTREENKDERLRKYFEEVASTTGEKAEEIKAKTEAARNDFMTKGIVPDESPNGKHKFTKEEKSILESLRGLVITTGKAEPDSGGREMKTNYTHLFTGRGITDREVKWACTQSVLGNIEEAKAAWSRLYQKGTAYEYMKAAKKQVDAAEGADKIFLQDQWDALDRKLRKINDNKGTAEDYEAFHHEVQDTFGLSYEDIKPNTDDSKAGYEGDGVTKVVNPEELENGEPAGNDISDLFDAPKDVEKKLHPVEKSVSNSPKKPPQTVQRIKAAIGKAWGNAFAEKLLNSGVVRLCSSDDLIETAAREASRVTGQPYDRCLEFYSKQISPKTQAFYDRNTKKVYINSDIAQSEDINGTIAHEIGTHLAEDRELSPEIKALAKEAVEVVAKGAKEGNAICLEVQKRMREAGETSPSETLAYLAEVTINSKGMRAKESRGLFAKLIDLFNRFLNKLGINRTMTKISDIVGMVEGYTRAAVDLNAGPSRGEGLASVFTSDMVGGLLNERTYPLSKGTKKRFDRMKPGEGGLPTVEEMKESIQYALDSKNLDPKSLSDDDLSKLLKAYQDLQVFYNYTNNDTFSQAVTEYSRDDFGIADIEGVVDKAKVGEERIAGVIREHYQHKYPLPPGTNKSYPALAGQAVKLDFGGKECFGVTFVGMLHDYHWRAVAESACLALTAYKLRGINIDIESVYFTRDEKYKDQDTLGKSGYGVVTPVNPGLIRTSRPSKVKYAPVIYLASNIRDTATMIHELYHARDRKIEDKNSFQSEDFKSLDGVKAKVIFELPASFKGTHTNSELHTATTFGLGKGKTDFSEAMNELLEMKIFNESLDDVDDSVEYIVRALAYPVEYCRSLELGMHGGRYDKYIRLAKNNPQLAARLMNRDSKVLEELSRDAKIELSAEFAGCYLGDALFRNNLDRAVKKHPELKGLKTFIEEEVLDRDHHEAIEMVNKYAIESGTAEDYIPPTVGSTGENYGGTEKTADQKLPGAEGNGIPGNGVVQDLDALATDEMGPRRAATDLPGRGDKGRNQKVRGRHEGETPGGGTEGKRRISEETLLRPIQRSVASAKPTLEEVSKEVRSHGITHDLIADIFSPELADRLEDIARAFKKHAAFKLWTQTYQLAQDAAKVGLTHAHDLYKSMCELQTKKQELQRAVKAIENDFVKLSAESRERVNRFLEDTTVSNQWGFKPDWGTADEWGKTDKDGNYQGNKIDQEMAKKWEALSAEEQNVIKEVLRYGYEQGKREEETIEVMRKNFNLKERKVLPKYLTPYVPLVRKGSIVVVYKSKDYSALEDKIKGMSDQLAKLETQKEKAQKQGYSAKGLQNQIDKLTEDRKKLREDLYKMRKQENNYVVSFADSNVAAGKTERELLSKYGDKGTVERKAVAQNSVRAPNEQEKLRLLTSIREGLESKFGEKTAEILGGEFMEIYSQITERGLHDANRRRENIAGYEKNIMQGFVEHNIGLANRIANASKGLEVAQNLAKCRKDLANLSGEKQREATAYFNELESRVHKNTHYEPNTAFDKFSSGARQFETFHLLTFKPSFYIQNGFQPLTHTFPALAGRYGGQRAAEALMGAYGKYGKILKEKLSKANNWRDKYSVLSNLVEEIVNDPEIKLTEGQREMLKYVMNLGLIDMGLEQDFGEISQQGKYLGVVGRTAKYLSGAARTVEIVNRFTSAMAAYELATKDGKLSPEATKEYVADILNRTQGDYSAVNAAPIFNTKLGKLALQFRKFQVIQFAFFADALKQYMKGATPLEKQIAKRQLLYACGVHAAIGGVMGLPAATTMMMLLGALSNAFGDDDGEDGEQMFRRWVVGALGKDIGSVVTNGILTPLGVNMTNQVGAGTMLSLTPFSKKQLGEQDGVKEVLFSLMGPFVSDIARMHDGFVNSNAENNWRPFTEAVLPKGIPQLLKSLGVIDMRYNAKTGEKMLQNTTLADHVLSFLGYTPESVERMYGLYRASKNMQDKHDADYLKLKKQYLHADRREQIRIQVEWAKLNAFWAKRGFTAKKAKELESYSKTKAREEANRINGVKTTSTNREAIRRLSKIY